MDWSVVGIGVTIGLAILVWIRRKYYTRPELTMELKPNGGHSVPLGMSNNQGEPDEIQGTHERPIYVYDAEKALRIFEKKWDIKLFIRNNSDHTAYYPKIHFSHERKGFTSIDTLNTQVPIGSRQEIVLKAEYKELEETTGRNRTEVRGLPPALDDLKICLEYKNRSKRTYYSFYDNKTKTIEFKRKLNNSFVWKI
ncbi:MAG TPA: hypothetical protein VHB54_11590 [Mucilaginibacter sp.]|nr:hypothetical protein [Mucilaginibacter sp.]